MTSFADLTVTAPASGSLVVTPVPDGGQLPANGAQSKATAAFGGVGGSGVVSVDRNDGTVTGTTGQYVWVGLDTLNVNGTGTGQHVARYAQANRWAYGPGGAAANCEVWAGCFEVRDGTGQKSSSTDSLVGVEVDVVASGPDDAQNRTALSLVAFVDTPRAIGWADFNSLLSLSGNDGTYVRTPIKPAVRYTSAAIDLRYTMSYAQNQEATHPAAETPKVTAAVTASTVVPVSNIAPFMSNKDGDDLNVKGGFNFVYFSNGVQATISSYQVTGTGPCPAGNIILATPATLAAGLSVYNNSRVIWTDTGAQFGLDTAGNTGFWSDGGSINFKGVLRPDGGGIIFSSGTKLVNSAVPVGISVQNGPMIFANTSGFVLGNFTVKYSSSTGRLQFFLGTTTTCVASLDLNGNLRLAGTVMPSTTP